MYSTVAQPKKHSNEKLFNVIANTRGKMGDLNSAIRGKTTLCDVILPSTAYLSKCANYSKNNTIHTGPTHYLNRRNFMYLYTTNLYIKVYESLILSL